jgi:hypothetical protein
MANLFKLIIKWSKWKCFVSRRINLFNALISIDVIVRGNSNENVFFIIRSARSQKIIRTCKIINYLRFNGWNLF